MIKQVLIKFFELNKSLLTKVLNTSKFPIFLFSIIHLIYGFAD
jgi:hypothetical protein